MKESGNLIRVFSGTELTVDLLKEELEKAGIDSLIQNDFNSGIAAGFSGGIPTAIDLFIEKVDLERATPIIAGFNQINKE